MIVTYRLKEIADECGVSEQAIRGWCRRNHVAKDAKGSFAISESIKTLIYQYYLGIDRNHVAKLAKANNETCESSETRLIDMLQKELENKNQQIEVKDRQIEELNQRLAECTSALVVAQKTAQAAQALHAGTIQHQLSSDEKSLELDIGKSKEVSYKKSGILKKFFLMVKRK